MATKSLHPLVQWAQRESIVYVTVAVDKVDTLEVTAKSLHVKGTYAGAATVYEATVEFYADVKTDFRKIDSGRHLELVITKEVESWWPRFLKTQGKVPWLKVDFNKWKDEDEEEDEVEGGGGAPGGPGGGFDFNQYMANNMGGAGGVPNLDDFDDDEDTEDMPDLEDGEDEVNGKDDAKKVESAATETAAGDNAAAPIS